MNFFLGLLVCVPIIFVISLAFEYTLFKSFENPEKKIFGHILVTIIIALFAAKGRYDMERTFLYEFFIASIALGMGAGLSIIMYLIYFKLIKKRVDNQ